MKNLEKKGKMEDNIAKVNVIFINCLGREIFENIYEDGIIVGFKVEYQRRIPHENIERIIEELKTKLQKYGNVEEIHFVDESYMINHYYTEEGKQEFNNLHEAAQLGAIVNFHESMKFFKETNFNPNEAYFIASYDNFMNEFHFLENLEMAFENNYFITWNIRNFSDISKAKCYYDPFYPIQPSESLDMFGNRRIITPKIEGLLREGAIQTKYFKEAGFLKRQRFIQKLIPAWTLNVESCIFTSGMIRRYRLFPEDQLTEDKTVIYRKTIMEQFKESADYRYQLTDLMLRILARHIELNLNGELEEDYRKINLNFFIQSKKEELKEKKKR